MSKLEIPPTLSHLKGLRWEPAMLIDYQNVSLEDVLPGLFYIVRLGRRRGKGHWNKKTAHDVAAELCGGVRKIDGCHEDKHTRVLEEWLKASVLRLNERSGSEKVMSVKPLHLMTYRVDLPTDWVHLRSIPEFVAAILHQDPLDGPRQFGRREVFGLQSPDNLLWKSFGGGLVNDSHFRVPDQDRYDDAQQLDIESLLTVRVVEKLKPPLPVTRGGHSGEIPGLQPLCPRQAGVFREDFSAFLRAYPPPVIPLPVLSNYLLCLLSLNLTSYSLCHFAASNHLYGTAEWVDDRQAADGKRTWELGIYADQTGGQVRRSRALARESYSRHHDWMMQQLRTMIGFRLLDHYLSERSDDVHELHGLRELRGIARLQTLALGRQPSHPKVFEAAQAAAGDLASLKRLKDSDEGSRWEEDIRLHLEDSTLPPFDRLVELLASFQPEFRQNMVKYIASVARRNLDSGLLAGTRVSRGQDSYYTLGIQFLEALVQSAVIKRNRTAKSKPMDIYEFVKHMKDRYGIWIDEPPPGLDQSYEARQAARDNFEALKEQLRQLGFFRAVTDAHRMQRLVPRYRPIGDLEQQGGEGDDE